MGICFQEAKMLWEARLQGASFRETATIAHLSLFLHPRDVSWLRRASQDVYGDSSVRPLRNYRFGDYSDDFFRDFLGADSVVVLDRSPYEGATLIHDLNHPIGEDLWGRFDAVIDGGSLEHIFNFPVAIANVLKMVKVGGRVFISTAANNLCGHGFYQFSPELMFRIFTKENGFALHRVVLLEAPFPSVERTSNRTTFEVKDPAGIGKRVGLVSRHPVVMMVEASKVQDLPLFARPPLQSDYVTRWRGDLAKSEIGGLKGFLQRSFLKLPLVLQRRIIGYRELRDYSLSNTRYYKRGDVPNSVDR